MKNYKTIMTDGLFESEVKKSRFICQMKRVYEEEDARAFINQIKKTHYKANHSCSAMIIGDQSQIKRSSDDGEPSGTAGIPMLSVLEKQGLTNVVAVVTRYFGGVKLGTGGLIRAYSAATSATIKALKIVEVKEQVGLEIELSYPQYQLYSQFLEQVGLIEMETVFLEVVQTKLYLDAEDFSSLTSRLTDFYFGKVTFSKIPPKIIELPLNDSN